ncbi:hypothetical protein HOY80DRAFT_972105 [Tuber brumale]|nr:hypothetical protein HOY80DRAFT_972105 [Tuber brumale]
MVSPRVNRKPFFLSLLVFTFHAIIVFSLFLCIFFYSSPSREFGGALLFIPNFVLSYGYFPSSTPILIFVATHPESWDLLDNA